MHNFLCYSHFYTVFSFYICKIFYRIFQYHITACRVAAKTPGLAQLIAKQPPSFLFVPAKGLPYPRLLAMECADGLIAAPDVPPSVVMRVIDTGIGVVKDLVAGQEEFRTDVHVFADGYFRGEAADGLEGVSSVHGKGVREECCLDPELCPGLHGLYYAGRGVVELALQARGAGRVLARQLTAIGGARPRMAAQARF